MVNKYENGYIKQTSHAIASSEYDVGALGTKLHIFRRLPKYGLILEIGPGHGGFLQICIDGGIDPLQISAIDISKETSEFVAKRFPKIKVYSGDLNSLP